MVSCFKFTAKLGFQTFSERLCWSNLSLTISFSYCIEGIKHVLWLLFVLLRGVLLRLALAVCFLLLLVKILTEVNVGLQLQFETFIGITDVGPDLTFRRQFAFGLLLDWLVMAVKYLALIRKTKVVADSQGLAVLAPRCKCTHCCAVTIS